METTVVNVEGVQICLGGKTYICPPLAMGPLKQLRQRIATWGGDASDASMDTVVIAAFHALKRNYPEITMEELENSIDFLNMFDVMDAVMAVSALRDRLQKGAALGEVNPG